MKYLLTVCSLVGLSGCLSAPKNPKVYEDDNVAIYKVCNPSIFGYICRQEVVHKKPLSNVNVDVK